MCSTWDPLDARHGQAAGKFMMTGDCHLGKHREVEARIIDVVKCHL